MQEKIPKLPYSFWSFLWLKEPTMPKKIVTVSSKKKKITKYARKNTQETKLRKVKSQWKGFKVNLLDYHRGPRFCVPLLTDYFSRCFISKFVLHPLFLSPINNVEGGYRNSLRPSIRPSVRNESPLTGTIFHRSLPNLYSMFIPMQNFIMCSFIKSGKNCCRGNGFSF